MRKLLTLLTFLLMAGTVSAQSTTVSGTIADAGGQAWIGGTYIFTFVQGPNPPPFKWTGGTLNTTISGALDGTGSYSVGIPSNPAITPGGTAWVAQFCPQATSACFSTGNFTVQGASMTIAPTPPAIAISLINPSPGLMRAYSDAEIASAIVASQYYNLLNSQVRICTTVSGQLCTGWVNSAGGSGITPPAGDIGGSTSVPTVVSTHLASPLPVNQGGTGTTTPALIPGTNISITGSWPNQTINSSAGAGVTSLNGLTGGLSIVAGSNITVTPGGSNITISGSGGAGPTAAIKPDPTSGIIFVAQTCTGGSPCSDANDGLSWGTAKATPYAALLALPHGATSPPTAGNGVVYVANDLNGISFGGPVPTGGWWMFGPTDPNYSGGLSGWMRSPTVGSVTMQCSAPTASSGQLNPAFCQEFWGGRTDNVHPAIWFNGFATGVSLIGFGFNYEATGFKLGIDSTNAYGPGGFSNALFDRVAYNPGSCYSNIGAGPGVDISGATFWVTFSHSAFGGCSTLDYSITAISRTSNVVTVTINKSGTGDVVAGGNRFIIIRNVTDPSFDGAYQIQTASGTSLTFNQVGPNASSSGGQAFPNGAAAISEFQGGAYIYLEDVSFGGGGVWMQGGASGVGLTAKNITYEGNGNPDMSVFEYLPTNGFVNSFVNIDDVQYADNSVSICGVEGLIPGRLTVSNTSVCGYLASLNASIDAPKANTIQASALRQGMRGIYNSRMAMNTDMGRHSFSPVAVRATNIVGPPFSWTIGGGITVTTGILAPDGTTGAVTMNNTGSNSSVNFGGVFAGVTPQIGSYYIFGVWVRSNTPGVFPTSPTYSDTTSGNVCAGNYLSGQGINFISANVTSPPIVGDGQWNWYGGVCKIIGNSGSGNQRLDMAITGGVSVTAYGPVLALFPSGTLTDNDAWELANDLASYPSTAVAGDVAMFPGQRFAMATPTSNFLYLHQGTPTANRIITWPDYPGTVAMVIASGSQALGTSIITNGTCATVVTVSASGVLTTDNVAADFNADPTSTAGYNPATGILSIVKWAGSGNVNFKVCNVTGSDQTPGAVTLNWRVTR
jgi:hypothetical protein